MSHQWDDIHIAAGYHEQEWEIPKKDSQLIGTYESERGGIPMTLDVRWLEAGPTGAPELELEWGDGTKVTVLDEQTAIEYLILGGSATVES